MNINIEISKWKYQKNFLFAFGDSLKKLHNLIYKSQGLETLFLFSQNNFYILKYSIRFPCGHPVVTQILFSSPDHDHHLHWRSIEKRFRMKL
jgi:hypothetical protein